MTKPWFYQAACKRVVTPRSASLRHRLTAAATLAAALILVVLLSVGTPALDAGATRIVVALPPAPEASSVATPAPRAVRPVDPRIEALAGIIARKYRVSEEATREFVRTAFHEGARNGVDPLLIVSVMAVESRFNPVAQSDGGAVGLMQVIPRFHRDQFDATNQSSALDPHTNIQVGVRILKEYIGRGGNELAGLQLYNGASSDASLAYATRVLGEKQSLQDAVRRARVRV